MPTRRNKARRSTLRPMTATNNEQKVAGSRKNIKYWLGHSHLACPPPLSFRCICSLYWVWPSSLHALLAPQTLTACVPSQSSASFAASANNTSQVLDVSMTGDGPELIKSPLPYTYVDLLVQLSQDDLTVIAVPRSLVNFHRACRSLMIFVTFLA